MILRAVTAFVAVALLAGCAGQARTGGSVFYPIGQGPLPPDPGPHVTMKYLGNGGWILRYADKGRDDVVATAPFFSNPRGLSIYLPGEGRPEVVDRALPAVDFVGVKTILIGHAHYDHAMDLPHILMNQARGATLYGGKTVYNLFSETLKERNSGVPVVENVADQADRQRWVPDDETASVRFLPLRSQHAPHAMGFLKVVSWGSADNPVRSFPWFPFTWPEGDTLAYLIDFRRDRQIVFRIYYQDSAAPPGVGVIPMLDEKDRAPVDVAILCVAGSSQVKKSPRSILKNVKPRFVVGGHWEDFFTPFIGDGPHVAMGTSLEQFVRRAHKAVSVPVFVPVPGETLRFPLRSP